MTPEKQLKKIVRSIAKKLEKLVASGKPEKVAEYLGAVCDVEMAIGGNFKYRSVCIQLVFGGPNVYFNSATGEVKGCWGFTHFVETVSDEVCYAVDDYYEDYFESCR